MLKYISSPTVFLIVTLLFGHLSAKSPIDPDLPRTSPSQAGMDKALLLKAKEYALTGGGSGRITRHGKLVFEWGDQKKLYDLKSTTKSFGATALGIALKDNKIKLSDKASIYHPNLGIPPQKNITPRWLKQITIFQLATQTAGFDKPGGSEKLLFAPGTKWSYSDSGPNYLAECLTLIYKKDLYDLMFKRVFTPIGIKKSDLTWRRNQYRPALIKGIQRREFGSGISANVSAMARIGLLYLYGGKWKNKQIITKNFVDKAAKTPSSITGLPVLGKKSYVNASSHYGLLWWNNNDGTLKEVPTDAFWSWGLYESLIIVIPSLDIVVARAGRSWKRKWSGHYSVLEPFFNPIVASVKLKSSGSKDASSRRAPKSLNAPPYPPSSTIRKVTWAPLKTVIRMAEGSDNWPTTWADDNNLYTAYGDGWGFKPRSKDKLSLGIAMITGYPPEIRGINIRTKTGERFGQGSKGGKASGLVMVKGVLYMLARNMGNSQLAFSKNRGKTWTWCKWKFTKGFGCPTFLNFSKNYSGSRDNYIYIYSSNSDSAYKASNTMVLARVLKDKITERSKYEFFAGFADRLSPRPRQHQRPLIAKGINKRPLIAKGINKQPLWTKDINKRKPVFTNAEKCWRSGITYNAGLKRYLWCQVLPATSHTSRGPRFEGGFGIYDAPEPWGPWTTVYFTERWDTGPGETCSLPSKWMSKDGKTCHMVFSGNDSFSVRKVLFN